MNLDTVQLFMLHKLTRVYLLVASRKKGIALL